MNTHDNMRVGGGSWALGAATVATGLAAGSFFVFSCAVMPALARSDDHTYVAVMRNINDVIQNPVFFASFLGAPVLIAVAAWQQRHEPGVRGSTYAALGAYALAFVLTSAVNVPLNDALARATDPAAARAHFEGPWVAWNAVRAGLCTLSLGFLARACLGRLSPRRPRISRRRPGRVPVGSRA
ncbi:hypothetical protein DWB77_04740 [Streptomyces hundungensis]|uniref:DUF1772 domain-containing protein n=1 Tax=Streptomyces hundungensis TaxID=1077946 RepID=A0A387HNU7_9ACTN|nr:anthrone oxygenase family protein [Streptomyces hundungensis]AYG82560.1 hypothetical protein DWB77_04740 [Streptomyces hundungensis]